MKNIYDELEIVKNKKARNRVIMAPMDTMMSDDSGQVNDLHIQHYGARAFGGVGTIIVEAVGVSRDARITNKDIGLWSKDFVPGLRRLSKVIQDGGALAGIQLGHAGAASLTAKIRYGGFDTFPEKKETYKDATSKYLDKIVDEFVFAAQVAKDAKFDFIEIHAAHGYLLNQLICNLNTSTTGEIVERAEVVIRIIKTINTQVGIRMGIRLSVFDDEKIGNTIEELKPLVKEIDKYVDYFSISEGIIEYADIKDQNEKLYMTPYASKFKSITSKNIIYAINATLKEDVGKMVSNADGAIVGRELLFNPNFVVTDLIDESDLDDEKYHWNKNAWYTHKKYKRRKNFIESFEWDK